VNEERILSMSAFEAAFLVRSFRHKNPNFTASELVQTARAIRVDFYPHDYDTGVMLEALIAYPDSGAAMPLEEFFTAAIDSIISERGPLWARLAPAGRNHVMQAIGINGVQCLRGAGLLENSDRATAWWDALANANRSEKDARLLAQGREGERLSLAYETDRLQQEGIPHLPSWIAIEDNTVGYDILSYALVDGHETSRLIEVKTTYANPPRMILSRNEWKTAEQFGTAFEFHLWELTTKTLTILPVDLIKAHIPIDKGNGHWLSVEIKMP
jgi:hypothetical protein